MQSSKHGVFFDKFGGHQTLGNGVRRIFQFLLQGLIFVSNWENHATEDRTAESREQLRFNWLVQKKCKF